MITQERLKELLDYDPETGVFTWKVRIGSASVGKIAGTINTKGYRMICISRVLFGAHRLAWLYVYGSFPKIIDHINQDKTDNSIDNLRECSQSQNQANRKSYKGSSSVYKGVFFSQSTSSKLWQSQIRKDGNLFYIGRYATEEEAARAYNEKAIDLFGEFAHLNDIPEGDVV